MSDSTNSSDAGTSPDVTLLSNHAPPLQDGTYRIEVSQEVFAHGKKKDGPYEAEYDFVVTGKQFQLPDGAVHSVYPPHGSTGLYDGHLPHVVLNTTAFPWQRTPGPDVTTPPATWLALFLVDGTEGIPQPQQGTVADLKEARPDGVFFPYDALDKGPTFDTGTACSYVDVPAALFNEVAPSTADLPYLAHVRETDATEQALNHGEARSAVTPLSPTVVGTNGKSSGPSDGNPATNERAVIVGTRLPKAALEREENRTLATQNTVFLVSLEGYPGHLPGDDGTSNLPDGIHTVRLVTLHQWTFNAAKHEYRLWKVLDTPPEKAPTRTVKNPKTGQTLEQKSDVYTDVDPPVLHLPSNDSDSMPDAATAALRSGFTPVPYHTRTGDEVAAWFRGPLSPLSVDTLPHEGPFDHADQLLGYDEDTGLFDISYAAAYQMGRLLALNDGHAAEAIARWRAATLRRVRRAHTRTRLADAHPLRPDAASHRAADSERFESDLTDTLAETLAAFLE